MNLRTTREGHLVLLHNETVDQITGDKGRIQDLDFDFVEKLVITVKDISLHHIAGYEDALKTFKHRINIYLNFKAASVPETYQAIMNAGMQYRVFSIF